MNEASKSHSEKRTKSLEADNYNSGAPSDTLTKHMLSINEEAAPKGQLERRQTELFRKSSFIDKLDRYTSMKEQNMKE